MNYQWIIPILVLAACFAFIATVHYSYTYGVKDTEMRWHEAVIKKRETSIQKLESSLNEWFGDKRSRAQFQHNEIHDLAIRMWDVLEMEP